jgi:hypothetical protein
MLMLAVFTAHNESYTVRSKSIKHISQICMEIIIKSKILVMGLETPGGGGPFGGVSRFWGGGGVGGSSLSSVIL